jgi:antitoxin VapB
MHDQKQLNIKNAEAYDLASEIAGIRGGSLTEAVLLALRGEAERARRARDRDARIAALLDHGRRYREVTPADTDLRTPDEIIGYDENGLPT